MREEVTGKPITVPEIEGTGSLKALRLQCVWCVTVDESRTHLIGLFC
jgi:hypothetical protein